MGARDLSTLIHRQSNRQPIQTEVQVFNEDFIRDAIYFETERGGQVFIHNRVAGLAEMANNDTGLCPDLSDWLCTGKCLPVAVQTGKATSWNSGYWIL